MIKTNNPIKRTKMGALAMAKKSKTSFKKKKKEDTHKRNDREEYSAEFNQVIHNNPQQLSKKSR